MTEILIAIISALTTIIIAGITRHYRKQEAADEDQDKLVSTLKDLVRAQDDRIGMLEKHVTDGTEEIRLLRLQVVELREVIVSQALLIQELSAKTALN